MVSASERRRRQRQSARDRSASRSRGTSRGRARSPGNAGPRSRSREHSETGGELRRLRQEVQRLERLVSQSQGRVVHTLPNDQILGRIHRGTGLPHLPKGALVAAGINGGSGIHGLMGDGRSAQPMELLSDWYDIKSTTSTYKWYLKHIKNVPDGWKATHYISGVWVEIDCFGNKSDIRGVWYLMVTNQAVTSAKDVDEALRFDWQEMPSKYHFEKLSKDYTDCENFGFIVQPLITKGIEGDDGVLALARNRVGFVFSPRK